MKVRVPFIPWGQTFFPNTIVSLISEETKSLKSLDAERR